MCSWPTKDEIKLLLGKWCCFFSIFFPWVLARAPSQTQAEARTYYGDNNYYYNDGDGGSEYGTGGDYVQCFNCVYLVQQGQASGMEDCNDPFDRTGIPVVTCAGSCAVSGDVGLQIYLYSFVTVLSVYGGMLI